jgi:TPR repeat protein
MTRLADAGRRIAKKSMLAALAVLTAAAVLAMYRDTELKEDTCYAQTVVGHDVIHSTEQLEARAQKGDTEAQTTLGIYFLGDEGYPRLHGGASYYAKAASFFQMAAEHGDPVAQFNLGRLYFKGKGLPQNAQEAFFWVLLAERNKNNTLNVPRCDFPVLRKTVALTLSPQERVAVEKRVREWESARKIR